MSKDQRLYGKLSLDFPDHPKIAILSDSAFRCLVEATLWSRKQETDGFLARRLATRLWPLDALLELTLNDDANPSLIERPEGWYIHDYAAHQDTKAEIEARRTRNKLAGQKGGLAKSKQVAKQNASKSLSENLAEEEEEEEKEIKEHVPQLVGGCGGKLEKPKPRRKTPRTPLPDSWHPNPEAIQRMRSQYPHLDLKAECEAFTNHHQAHGNVMADWTKAFWTWLGNTNKFGPNGKPTGNNGKPPHKMRVLAELAQTVRAAENAAQLTPAHLKELQ